MKTKILTIIENASDKIIAAEIIKAFTEIEKKYFLKEWKTSELESGHFVEIVRRLVEFKLFGSYTPLGKALPIFNEQTLLKYENSTGNESYRIIIPRIIYSIYCIRNKRGIGHLTLVSANHQDATFILSSCKWVLAEIIRLESSLNPDSTLTIIESIIEREIEGIWEEGDVKRILKENLNLKESILFLLFSKNIQPAEALRNTIEYKNKTYFYKILKELHADRFLELKHNSDCILSPKGRIEAEKIILR